MNEQDYLRLKPIVQYESVAIAEDTSIVIDAEDIEQEMWLHLNEKWSYYSGKEDGFVRVGIRKVGKTYCMEERYRYTHYSAQYVYTNEEVRQLFKSGFFEEAAWQDVPKKGDYKLTVDEGGVTVALWDIRAAYDSLSKPEREAIFRKYALDDQLDTTERKRLSRAVDAVTRYLNSKVVAAQESRHDYDNGPGARRAITNAHALAITE